METEPEAPLTPVEAVDEDEEGGPIKTFLEHLEDLRWVLIRVVASLMIGFVGCFAGARQLVWVLEWPLLNSEQQIKLEFLGPMAGYMVAMKVALYGGITLTLPFILFFIAQYVMPALKRNEKDFFRRAFIIGGGLFLLGVLTCFFFVLPITITATAQFNAWLNVPTSIWRAEEYFQFVILFMVGMGLSFELPILLLGLVKLGLLQYKTVAKGRPYVLLVLFTIISFITPDFVSTFFIMIPLIVLMEVCIWIAWYWDRQERRKARAEG